MKKQIVIAIASILVAAGVLFFITAGVMNSRSQSAGSGGSSSDSGSFVDNEDWRDIEIIEDFTLIERSGRKFRSQELDGEVWVASFFFSSCPSSCKQQNEIIRRLHEKWGAKGVTFVSITCDPETDDPERLREYAHTFGAHPDHWQFLTGELLHVRRIGGEVFGVHVEKGVHMDRLTLVDRWGKVRGHFDWHDPVKVDELEESMEKLLAETSPPVEEQKTAGTEAESSSES